MSAKLREMLDKRNKAVTDARALIDKADVEKRVLTAEEKTSYDAFLKDALDLRERIDAETKLIEEERQMAQDALKGIPGKPSIQAPEVEARKLAFRKFLRNEPMTGEEVRAMTAGTDVQGGFLMTPQEFVKNLIVAVKNVVFIRGLATIYQTNNANGIGMPSLDTDVGDFEWTPEITAFPEDTAVRFGKRELKPHPLKKLIKVSEKLLRADGMDPEAILMDRASYKLGITNEKAFLTGTGSQQPLGLFTASDDGVPTSRDLSTDMTATDFTADALKAVKYSLKAQYMAKAQWLFHRDGVAKIAKIKTGDGYYIFELADKVGAIDTLLGRPLNMSEYVPNTFTASKYVGMFADFSWYWIVDSLALRIKRLNELYAETSQVGFIFDAETDAMPVLAEAFTRIETASS